MPRRVLETHWLDDPAALADLGAVLRVGATGGRVDPAWSRRIRALQQAEFDLTEEQWLALDALDFPWHGTPPRRTGSYTQRDRIIDLLDRPVVDAARNRAELSRLATGQISFAEVVALRNDSTLAADPVALWFDRGFAALRESGTSLATALANPQLVESANYVGFALGRWAHEAKFAAALGFLDDAAAGLEHKPTRAERFTLRNFGLVARWKAETGLDVVPTTAVVALADGSEYNLGNWVAALRRRARRNALPLDLAVACRRHGIHLEPISTRVSYQRGLQALDQFRAREGHLEVPLPHLETVDGVGPVKLGEWVSVKRRQYQQGRLPVQYFADLESRGFVWSVYDERFTAGLKLLTRFAEEHGHVDVPQRAVVTTDDGGTFALGAWVSSQRNHMRRGTLPVDRRIALENLGFTANVWDAKWARDLAAFDAFVAEHGHGRVPRTHIQRMPDGTAVKLGSWCRSTRHRNNRGEFSAERIADLQAHGFVFTIDRPTFDDGLAALARFHEREGHADVPFRHGELLDDGTTLNLGIWLTRIRQGGRRGTLAPEKAAAVAPFGVSFDLKRSPNGVRADRGR